LVTAFKPKQNTDYDKDVDHYLFSLKSR